MYVRFPASIEPRKAAVSTITLLVALTAGYFVYSRYFGVQAGPVGHEALASPNTAVRIMFRGPYIQDYVSRIAPDVLKVVPAIPRLNSLAPRSRRLDWVHYLPTEFAFLISQNTAENLDVLLYIGENEDGPDFAGVINDSEFFWSTSPITWRGTRVRHHEDGGLVALGAISLPDRILDESAASWPVYTPPVPLPLSGAHFFEATADNRAGAVFELHGAVDGAVASPLLAPFQPMLSLWPLIETCRVTGDLAGDDLFEITAGLTCADVNSHPAIFAALEAALGGLQTALSAHEHLKLTWRMEESGADISVNAALTGFEAPLRRTLNPGI